MQYRRAQKVTVCVLVVYGLQSQLEVKEKKNEELCNACTRTVFGWETYLPLW